MVLSGGSRKQTIQDLFRQLGIPEALTRFTHRCIRLGIWDQTFQTESFFKAARKEVHEALGELDQTKMPFAGPTEDRDPDDPKSPIRVQRAMWEVDDYEFNAMIRVTHAMSRATLVCSRNLATMGSISA